MDRYVRVVSTSRIISNTNLKHTWRNHWHHHNCPLPHLKSHSQLKLDGDPSLVIKDYATFALTMYLKMRHTLCYSVSIREKFQSLFHKTCSLKSFFQIDISLYLTYATTLHHCRKLTGLTPPWCIFTATSHTTQTSFVSILPWSKSAAM